MEKSRACVGTRIHMYDTYIYTSIRVPLILLLAAASAVYDMYYKPLSCVHPACMHGKAGDTKPKFLEVHLKSARPPQKGARWAVGGFVRWNARASTQSANTAFYSYSCSVNNVWTISSKHRTSTARHYWYFCIFYE